MLHDVVRVVNFILPFTQLQGVEWGWPGRREPTMNTIITLLLEHYYNGRGWCVRSVFFPFILDIKFVGRTSRNHTGGRSHRISHPPSFCGACLNFSREKDSAIPFPRRP